MAQIRCFDMLEPKGDASTVDCLMASPSLKPRITKFTISGRPLGLAADHAYLFFKVKIDAKRMYMLINGIGHAKY